MTELDEALEGARKQSNQANFFYDAFLNAELFFPVQAEGSQRPSWRELASDEKFHPLFLPTDDLKVLPAFDLLERLQRWAAPRELDYVAIRGHVLVRLLSNDVGIVLNPASEYSYQFTPDILRRLQDAMKPVTPI